MKYAIVIPARFSSSRLPGKPLADINGKPMIQHVWERCVASSSADLVFIATDDKRIQAACEDFGGNVLMTSSQCITGTDRVAEVNEILKKDFIINVQGDEPMISPGDIQSVRDKFVSEKTDVVNAYVRLDENEDPFSLTLPKVVVSKFGKLLYMSRAPIPLSKTGAPSSNFKQVCIYAFGKEHLKFIKNNPEKSPIENIEDIEILRFLENGFSVSMVEVKNQGIAVDTPSDLKKVRQLLAAND